MAAQVLEMTWTELNDFLRTGEDEAEIKKLLDAEIAGKNRDNWKLRIHQRLNKLRREREEKALLEA